MIPSLVVLTVTVVVALVLQSSRERDDALSLMQSRTSELAEIVGSRLSGGILKTSTMRVTLEDFETILDELSSSQT